MNGCDLQQKVVISLVRDLRVLMAALMEWISAKSIRVLRGS